MSRRTGGLTLVREVLVLVLVLALQLLPVDVVNSKKDYSSEMWQGMALLLVPREPPMFVWSKQREQIFISCAEVMNVRIYTPCLEKNDGGDDPKA